MISKAKWLSTDCCGPFISVSRNEELDCFQFFFLFSNSKTECRRHEQSLQLETVIKSLIKAP